MCMGHSLKIDFISSLHFSLGRTVQYRMCYDGPKKSLHLRVDLWFTVPFGAFEHGRYLECPIMSVQNASDDLNQCYGVSGRCGGKLPSKSAVWQAVQTSAKGHL